MKRNAYIALLAAVAASVIAGVAAFGQSTGQVILTTLGGSELFAVQTSGPQSAAISSNNLKTWIASGGSAGPGAFTTLSASGAVSGAGFTARFAVPGPIGSTTPSTGAFTTLSASSGIDSTNVGATTPGSGKFTTLQNTTSAGLTVAVSTDATHTDATLCEDTTTHVVYFGSGTAGICLGTSSLRFKHDVEALNVGLREIMALEPISYKLNETHGDPNHILYGFSAEQGGKILPLLMDKDTEGRPNSFDYLGVVPVLVRAIQEQQAEIEALKRRIPERQAVR